MRPLLLSAIFLAAAVSAAAQLASDPVLTAMHREIERARDLQLPNLDKPYFIQDRITETNGFSVQASGGAIEQRNRWHNRANNEEVRVGDYKFDNTNFIGSGRSSVSAYGQPGFPVEDDYPVLLRYVWLNLDRVYKEAVDAIARKRAAMRNFTTDEPLNDFAHATPVHNLAKLPALKVEEDAWTNRTRELSKILLRYPEVTFSEVQFSSQVSGERLVNSEGTEVRQPQFETALRVWITARASDGKEIRDCLRVFAPEAGQMPPEAEMRQEIAHLAENTVAMARAAKGQDYNGPVLFEGVAARQFLAQVLGANLSLSRTPVKGSEYYFALADELEGRLGARILPEWFDVVDDPEIKEWHGRPLVGSYEIDREGVPAKRLQVVEKGVFQNYLLTRQPVRGFEGSNGRARIAGEYGASSAIISNLLVNARETVPLSELKSKLIALCQTRHKPYGILVRRMDYPSVVYMQEAQKLLLASDFATARPVSPLLWVYKVFTDGREEPVRGLRLRGVNVKSLKDIMAAGDDAAPLSYGQNSAPFAMVYANAPYAPVSIVAPSILIDDIDLRTAKDEETPKLPVVPSPLMR